MSGTDWEVGIGTYTASGTTLSRDTILGSSNSGSAVNLGAGDKDVFCTYSAEKSVYEQADNKINASSGVVSGALFENPTTIATNYTVATGNNALTAGPITVNSGVSVTVPSGSRWVVV